jgi:hypothetical protein
LATSMTSSIRRSAGRSRDRSYRPPGAAAFS